MYDISEGNLKIKESRQQIICIKSTYELCSNEYEKSVRYAKFLLAHCCPADPKRGTKANSGDPDQMSHNAASDQGLHCLLTAIFA